MTMSHENQEFSMKHEFRKLFFVIRDLDVFRDRGRTDIRDFTTLLHDLETGVLSMVRVV